MLCTASKRGVWLRSELDVRYHQRRFISHYLGLDSNTRLDLYGALYTHTGARKINIRNISMKLENENLAASHLD